MSDTLTERLSMFESLKQLVVLDDSDNGSRIVGSNIVRAMRSLKSEDRIELAAPKGNLNPIFKGRKRVLLLIVDAAEYDRIDNLLTQTTDEH